MRLVFSMFTLILCISCGNQAEAVTPEENIIELFTDLYYAEALLRKQPIALADSLKVTYRNQISKIHGINPYDLDSIVSGVQSNVQYYKAVTDSVLHRVRLQSKKLDKIDPVQSKKENND